ncbi:hypothetical protein PFLUV_G00103940 [Perca fluviatilis]|uniref:Phorbol-ester/DAG-type domain-containing protein n=1 Tax=Perca fluviatilis TaxID=8168 RepID=A0A6A5F678_PERFL|nr:hypothetical protein PFLUV_G00103940 [Perca fluviatilis]
MALLGALLCFKVYFPLLPPEGVLSYRNPAGDNRTICAFQHPHHVIYGRNRYSYVGPNHSSTADQQNVSSTPALAPVTAQQESSAMKLNPQQAPLYGECVLTVQLDDDDVCRAEGEDEEEEEAEFYLLFSGSTQRHLSSTLRVSHVTLQAVCPAHNVCEQVLVTLCLARPGAPVDTHSRETFCFVQDLALDMAHFLLDNISPQEAFLLDDEQIGLKECERLDQSLALALKYLSLPPQRTGPALDTQTTHTPAHSGTDGDDTETQQEATAMDVSTLLDSCTGRSQCQQLSSLLHVAASHGLRTVAALVLQQPGGREALRTPDAQGQTAAAVARSRGHQQLLQLFTQYETSSNVQVELKEQPHVYPEGRVFQHHAALGTYTLTFPGLGQRGGGGEDRCIQEELKELRRRIGLHRDTQGNSSGAAALSPACRQQPCEQNAGLSAVTIETCSTTTEEQGSPPSLEERARGEDSAVTQTSCSSASLCQSQEAANSPASRNRKNKRRGRKTTRRAAESPGSNRGTPEVGGGIARRPTKATGSGRETDGATSPRASVTAQRGPATEETPLPRKPGSASGTDGKCAGRKAAALSTAIIVEKQEVDLLMCERVAETETVTRTEQGDTGRLPAGQADVKFAVESAAERTVTMGQEQSQDPQESQPGSEEPSQADTTDNSPQSGRRTSPKSPDSDRKPRRGLWRDGGWIGSRMGSIPQGPETVAKTVWYQGENLDQGASEAWKNSQSVWYDGDTTDQRTHEQLEQGVTKQKECDWSSAQASGLSSQVSAALSQPHAAGTQPALSQGPGAQRREVHGSQPEEEVGPDWKEGGVEGDGEEVTNRETSYSRQSSERADTEEGGEEKQGSQEKAAKSRKKRRNKRGKRGGAEGKLSSSSSIESQSRIEIKTDLKTQSETESEARDRTGRAEGKSPTQREETDKDAMLLPSQTEGQTRGAHGPDSPSPSDTPPDFSPADLTESTASQTPETKELSEDSKHFHGPDHFNPDSSVAASELGQMDIRKADVEDITAVQPVKKEVLDPTELELKGLVSPVQQTVDNVESNPLSENEDLTVAGQAVTSVDRTGLVDSDCPREIPFKLSDPTEFTENSFLVEFPVDPKGRPVGFMESVRPAEAGGLPSEGTADVLPLQIREGSAETTARGYSEHCLVSEMLRDQQHTDEKRNELWVGKEEAAKKRRRREENGSGMHRRELSSIDGEQEQDFNENLVGTAVAVVAVAIASAVASLELSQQLADSQSERQGSEDLLNTVQASQLMDTDRCPPVPCETGQQPVEHSRPTDRFPSQQAANVEISEVALECDTETGRLPAARLCYNQPAKLDLFVHADTPSLPHLHKEEIQKETTQNKVFTRSPPKEEEDGLLRVTGKPLPKANQSITSEVDGGGPVQVDVQLQHPEASEENPTPGELRGPQDHCSTLPVTPRDSTLAARPGPEEPPAPVNVETGEYQSSQASADRKLVPAGSSTGPESVAMDTEDALDAVDGWKDRERNKMKSEEKVPVDVPSQTAEEEEEEAERQLTGRPPDGTHPLHIQRERDAFCPEANTVPTCSDVSEECVPVCLLHKEDSVQLDNSVFKKPKAPPPCVGHRDRGAGVSLSPSEGALSVDTPDAVAPRSSRLAWKSQTEDRGGGGGGGGEEEENKDQLSDSPVSSSVSRASIRSLSPFRRHSWEPRRNNGAADVDITQRSSMKSLSEEVRRAKPPLHRRSMSWCPSTLLRPDQEQTDNRSYSLEALRGETGGAHPADPQDRTAGLDGQHSGSLVSLTEEEQDEDSQTSHQVLSATNSYPAMFHHQTLTKSISMVAISHRDIDAVSSFSSNSGTLEYSISEEEPGPLRSDTEGKGGPKISRTFSYLRSKMSKKGKEKEKERKGEKARESKEREKKSANGHLFILVSSSPSTAGCQHCSKALPSKESFLCSNCGASVHKSCRESLSVCTKSKTKQQTPVPEAVPGSAVNMRSKSTSSASSVSSASSSSSRERWTTAASPDDQFPVLFPRRHPSIFNTHSNLAKSISTSNIAGLDDVPLKGLKFLSQSTDSLHQGSKVNASTESLTDEGTEMMDSQLMGEFEWDVKDLEADSWSGTMDKKFLKTLKKDEIKKQDVIYELYQTEFHHVRTLKIMSDVYYKGLQKELQLDSHTLDKIFPVMDDLLDTHTHFLTLLLERKRASSTEAQKDSSFLICSIGDVLLSQFSGCSADRMKKVYGKFCSRHNEAVNLYKDLHAKDKRFQAFIKRTMSSSIVRRLSIPECILLVTQRITKYPVLIQRILQHTKDSDSDHGCVCDALRCVKQLITAVDSKVNEQEKKQRLREVYSRTDSKSIMRMKSGQMFAKEDLIRGRKMLHDGALQLKNSAGRLKDVQALLLSDVLVFLQEKDQKYVFASLDQRSTVISLQNLIVREVANEERGLFLITAGTERPEMVEVLASSKEERNTWRAIIQDAMHCMEKDEDEGVPSETEEDRRQQENRAKEIRELLRRKDEQILALLEEKVHIFRELGDWSPAPDDPNPPIRERMLFMATPDEVTKGEPIIKDALREVESLQGYVSSGVGVPAGLAGGASAGPVCLPRRAETFGGFDSHQMSSSKNGEKEEGDESLDLRRTESDSVLKKGGTASLQMLLKRNTEQVLHSVTHLHELLIALQAVVLQQDSFIEDQRQNLSDRLAATSSRHSSSSSLSSTSSSRPSSLIEQEKHRSLERQRQEAATLQKQQAAHQEEKRRREKAWELKEKSLAEREERLRLEEEQTKERRRQLTEEGELLLRKKEEYQAELERLKEAQRTLESEQEALRRDAQRLEAMNTDQSEQLQRYQRTPSTTSEDSIRFHSSGSLDLDSKEAAEQPKGVEVSSSAPSREPFLRIGSKRMGKSFNPFSSTSSSKPQGAEKESQLPSKLLQLSKTKEKKDKRNKKGKGEQTQTESNVAVMSDPRNDGDIFFC